MLHLFDVKVKECQQKLVGTFVVTCVVFVCMLASGCHKFSEAKKSGNHRNMSKISSFVKDPSNVETRDTFIHSSSIFKRCIPLEDACQQDFWISFSKLSW